MAQNEEVMEEEWTTLDQLEMDMLNETDPEKKLKLAQAYKTMKEAQDADWKDALELDMEDKKSKRIFWGTVIAAAVGSTVAGVIKAVSNNVYQTKVIEMERDDIYIPDRKMQPPNK